MVSPKADTFLPGHNLTLGDGYTNDFGTYSYNAIASSVTCNKGKSRDIDCNYYKDSSGNWVYTTNEVETDLGVPTMWEARAGHSRGHYRLHRRLSGRNRRRTRSESLCHESDEGFLRYLLLDEH